MEGKMRRLAVWFRKATEYCVAHRNAGSTNRAALNDLQLGSLCLTTTMTLLLVCWGSSVATLVAFGSATVAALTSWTKYAGYEHAAVGHTLSANRFAAIARDMSSFFAKVNAPAHEVLLGEVDHVVGLEKENIGPGGGLGRAFRDGVRGGGTRRLQWAGSRCPGGGEWEGSGGGYKPGAPVEVNSEESARGCIADGFRQCKAWSRAWYGFREDPGYRESRRETPEDDPWRESRSSTPINSQARVVGLKFGDSLNGNLQLMYRKSAEYALAHGREARRNGTWNDAISFGVLLIATATGLLLSTAGAKKSGDTGLVELSTVCAALITTLNAWSRSSDFSGLQERHGLAVNDFGNIARDLNTCMYLTAASREETVGQIDLITLEFNDAVHEMPPLPYRELLGATDDAGEAMFVLITDPALLSEANADPLLGDLYLEAIAREMVLGEREVARRGAAGEESKRVSRREDMLGGGGPRRSSSGEEEGDDEARALLRGQSRAERWLPGLGDRGLAPRESLGGGGVGVERQALSLRPFRPLLPGKKGGVGQYGSLL